MIATVRELAPGTAPGGASPNPQPLRLNLGCGRNIMPGWVNVDSMFLPGVDVIADLNGCRKNGPLQCGPNSIFATDSAEQFLLSHTLEHIQDSLALMQELHRIAKPNAVCTVRVPYGSSDDAWEDPTHVRAYFLQSWLYFSQPAYWRADYGYRGDWRPEHVELRLPKGLTVGTTAQELLVRVTRERNIVTEMVATLRAVKPIREPRRELQTSPQVTFIGI